LEKNLACPLSSRQRFLRLFSTGPLKSVHSNNAWLVRLSRVDLVLQKSIKNLATKISFLDGFTVLALTKPDNKLNRTYSESLESISFKIFFLASIITNQSCKKEINLNSLKNNI